MLILRLSLSLYSFAHADSLILSLHSLICGVCSNLGEAHADLRRNQPPNRRSPPRRQSPPRERRYEPAGRSPPRRQPLGDRLGDRGSPPRRSRSPPRREMPARNEAPRMRAGDGGGSGGSWEDSQEGGGRRQAAWGHEDAQLKQL